MNLTYLIIALFVVIGFLFLFKKIIEARNFQFLGNIIKRIDTNKKVVALTFDDGPNPPYTDHILSYLKEYNASATFFVLGRRLKKYPSHGQKIVREGHEIANHSYTHKYLLLRPPRTIRKEILKADEAIKEINSVISPYFRPPFGKKLFILPWYLKKMGKTTVSCDVDTGRTEFVSRDSIQISEIILKKVKPGSIIMLHEGGGDKSHIVDSVRIILEELTKKGFKVTSVSGLLEKTG